MKKYLVLAWDYGWAYFFIALKPLDRFGAWLEDQVDHNDYLAGAIGAVFLMLLPWLFGVIDIVVR